VGDHELGIEFFAGLREEGGGEARGRGSGVMSCISRRGSGKESCSRDDVVVQDVLPVFLDWRLTFSGGWS
jgi:hypothetical protein